ncbi:hypothetical protein BC826DRAFT_1046942, partial [Russula brevipes]
TRKQRHHLPYLIQLSPRPPLHALIGSQFVRFNPTPWSSAQPPPTAEMAARQGSARISRSVHFLLGC